MEYEGKFNNLNYLGSVGKKGVYECYRDYKRIYSVIPYERYLEYHGFRYEPPWGGGRGGGRRGREREGGGREGEGRAWSNGVQ